MEQNTTMTAAWKETHPFSAMLQSYQAALDGCRARLAELRRLAREQDAKGNVSPAECYLLEKRILTLRDECGELARDINDIRFYAEKECANEQKEMEPCRGQSAEL